MKERPIIFSTEMVKALFTGRKTQTRRVIKPQPNDVFGGIPFTIKETPTGKIRNTPIKCPYGQVGDRFWVRESYYTESGDVWYKADRQTAPMLIKWKPSILMPRWASRITLEIQGVRVERLQEITEEDAKAEGCQADKVEIWWQGYRKLTLGDLGEELLHQQAASPEPPEWMIEPHRMQDRPDLRQGTRDWFRHLWNSLNAKRGYGWSTNPWVWVIEFKRV